MALEHATSVRGGATVCFMRICDYKFAVYGFFAEHSEEIRMSDCCFINVKAGTAPAVMACPVNGTRSKQVGMFTVKSLLRKLPLGMANTQYYFCDASDCDVDKPTSLD
jgi:hypothetical protein